MRLALILLLTICGLARATDLLVLVPARDAGPVVPLDNYSHPTWILWPKAAGNDQTNRLLSLPSGVDWQLLAPVTYQREEKEYLWLAMPIWIYSGYHEAMRRQLGARKVYAYAGKTGETPTTSLLAASQDGVTVLGLTDHWPGSAIVVATVTGRNPWDEVAKLGRKAGGRVMVVELPDKPEAMWTRMWLQGKGWPDGVPVFPSSRIPGLVRSREAMRILADPEGAQWQPALSEPPNRWLDYGHQTSPVVLVFLGVVAIYIIGLGIYLTLKEIMSRSELLLLRLLIVGPAALVLAGRITSATRIDQWPIWHAACILGSFLLAFVVNRLLSRFTTAFHPLWGEFLVGLLTLANVDPAFSMFSHILGPHRAPVSPEAFGALAAYVVGARILMGASDGFKLITALVAGSVVLNALAGSTWLWPVGFARLLLVLVAYGGSSMANLRIWIPIMGGMGVVSALWLPGLAYAPAGLVRNYSQVGKFNCAEQIAFLMSPTFVCFCLVAIIAWIAGDKFLGHQFRRAMVFSPQPKAFFPIALCFAVAGVFIPLYLHAALATVIAGGVAVLFDAVRAP